MFYNNNFPDRQQQGMKQGVRKTVHTTKRRKVTTHRTPVTTRRVAQSIGTIFGNKVRNGVRQPVKTQRKPPKTNRVKN